MTYGINGWVSGLYSDVRIRRNGLNLLLYDNIIIDYR